MYEEMYEELKAMRMPAALKQHWIDALRSGDFKQGKNALRKEKDGEIRYCCLGVLVEIAEGFDEDPASGYLDAAFMLRHGITPSFSGEGIISPDYKFCAIMPSGNPISLPSVNDSEYDDHHDFNAIADVIEVGVEGYGCEA